MKDVPLQRQLKIGRATIGLVGLDIAMNRVLSEKDIDHQTAIEQLYSEVSKANYIPPGLMKEYREALAKEYDRLKSGEESEHLDLNIRILGPGCVSCNNLQTRVIEIMNSMGVAADIFQIHDLDEIGRFGIIQTPALIVNGKLKSSGRLPSTSQIEEWLREEIDER